MDNIENLLNKFNISKEEIIKILEDNLLDANENNIFKLLSFSNIFNYHPKYAIKCFRKPYSPS